MKVSNSHELACSLMIPFSDFFMKQINNYMIILFDDTEY